uniref:hypothetical protein n=1 Tax=Vibrio cholerae TaxID=666 RepID=UPI003F58AB6B
MYNEFKEWVESALGSQYQYSIGEWVDDEGLGFVCAIYGMGELLLIWTFAALDSKSCLSVREVKGIKLTLFSITQINLFNSLLIQSRHAELHLLERYPNLWAGLHNRKQSMGLCRFTNHLLGGRNGL